MSRATSSAAMGAKWPRGQDGALREVVDEAAAPRPATDTASRSNTVGAVIKAGQEEDGHAGLLVSLLPAV